MLFRSNDTATTEIYTIAYTLSLHDALPICVHHWCEDNGIEPVYIQPGKPNQNAYIERFNRSFRDALLDPYLFTTLSQFRDMAVAWMISYNEERPHDSLGRIPPAEFRRQITGEVSTFKLCA